MKARILLLGKDPYSFHKPSSNLQQFKQELIQVISEAKAFAFNQQNLICLNALKINNFEY